MVDPAGSGMGFIGLSFALFLIKLLCSSVFLFLSLVLFNNRIKIKASVDTTCNVCNRWTHHCDVTFWTLYFEASASVFWSDLVELIQFQPQRKWMNYFFPHNHSKQNTLQIKNEKKNTLKLLNLGVFNET